MLMEPNKTLAVHEMIERLPQKNSINLPLEVQVCVDSDALCVVVVLPVIAVLLGVDCPCLRWVVGELDGPESD